MSGLQDQCVLRLAGAGWTSSQELAQRTGTAERYVCEWLAAQAASGYIAYEPESGRYALEPEQAIVLADEDSPAFLAGLFDVAAAAFRAEDKILSAFRSGRGVGWHEQDRCLFCARERFFRTGYRHHLVGEWLPALDSVAAHLAPGDCSSLG